MIVMGCIVPHYLLGDRLGAGDSGQHPFRPFLYLMPSSLLSNGSKLLELLLAHDDITMPSRQLGRLTCTPRYTSDSYWLPRTPFLLCSEEIIWVIDSKQLCSSGPPGLRFQLVSNRLDPSEEPRYTRMFDPTNAIITMEYVSICIATVP